MSAVFFEFMVNLNEHTMRMFVRELKGLAQPSRKSTLV